MKTRKMHVKIGNLPENILIPVFKDEEDARARIFDYGIKGFCLGCGEQQHGVDPSAENYRCESCGRDLVYGYEQLFVMGLAEIGCDTVEVIEGGDDE
jgi:hypothetical protein